MEDAGCKDHVADLCTRQSSIEVARKLNHRCTLTTQGQLPRARGHLISFLASWGEADTS